jgi:hypothetical protein
VKWDLWTSSFDQGTVDLKKSFATVSIAFGDRVFFTPHFLITNGSLQSCTSQNRPCGDHCTNSGRYCVKDGQGPQFVPGADVIRENLRQKCIYKVVSSIKHAEKWWSYVDCFQSNCLSANQFTQDCSKECMGTSQVNRQNVDDCIAQSGGFDSEGPINAILEEELALSKSYEISQIPYSFMNNVDYEVRFHVHFQSQKHRVEYLLLYARSFP